MEHFIDSLFPFQDAEDKAFALRYRKQGTVDSIEYLGITVESVDITGHAEIDTYEDALTECINSAVRFCQETVSVSKEEIEKFPGLLYIQALKASNCIAKNTARGCGNFLIGRKDLLEKIALGCEKEDEYCGEIRWISKTINQYADGSELVFDPYEGTGITEAGGFKRFTCVVKDLGERVLVGYTGPRNNDSGVLLARISSTGKYKVVSNLYGTSDYYCMIEIGE